MQPDNLTIPENPKQYSYYLHWPLAALIFIGLLSLTHLFPSFVFGLMSAPLVLACLGIYIYQLRFISTVAQNHRLVRMHILLVAGSAVLPLLAYTLGDIVGANEFGTPSEWSPIILVWGLGLAATSSFILSLGNIFYIKSGGSSRPLKIIGMIFYVLLWLAVLAISYFTYAIVYSLHDPSTE